MAFHYLPLHPAAALENRGASPAAGRIQVRPAALCGGDIAAWMRSAEGLAEKCDVCS